MFARSLPRAESMGEVLGGERIALQLDALVPFARWRPDQELIRTFDTRFYLAEWPADAPEAIIDATENVRLFWGTAAHFLDEAKAGRASVIFSDTPQSRTACAIR